MTLASFCEVTFFYICCLFLAISLNNYQGTYKFVFIIHILPISRTVRFDMLVV